MTKYLFRRIVFTFLLVCGFTVVLCGQDLLVNSGGDSLNIHVTKIEYSSVYYQEPGSDDVILFPVNKVQLFIPDYFVANALPGESGLLVKSSGDSLKISMIRLERGFIHFSEDDKVGDQKHAANRIQLFIPKYQGKKKDVSTDGLGVSASTTSNSMTDQATLPVQNLRFELGSVRFYAQAGWSSMIAPIDPQMSTIEKEYLEGLRNGIHYGLGLESFFIQYLGAGIGYSYFNTSNELHEYNYTNLAGAAPSFGVLADEIGIHNAEIRLIGRFPFADNRLILHAHIAGGHVWYINKHHSQNININIKSTNFSGNSGLGLDYMISDNLGIGIQTGIMLSAVKDIRVDALDGTGLGSYELDNFSNISRIDISAGLRWYL